MELVLAGESRPDTTDLDRRKPVSRWQMHGLKAAFRNDGTDDEASRALWPSAGLLTTSRHEAGRWKEARILAAGRAGCKFSCH